MASRSKPGGLVVDYLGLTDQLKKALITDTESGGQEDPIFDALASNDKAAQAIGDDKRKLIAAVLIIPAEEERGHR